MNKPTVHQNTTIKVPTIEFKSPMNPPAIITTTSYTKIFQDLISSPTKCWGYINQHINNAKSLYSIGKKGKALKNLLISLIVGVIILTTIYCNINNIFNFIDSIIQYLTLRT